MAQMSADVFHDEDTNQEANKKSSFLGGDSRGGRGGQLGRRRRWLGFASSEPCVPPKEVDEEVDGTGDALHDDARPDRLQGLRVLGYICDPSKAVPAGTIALTRYYSSARKEYFLNERPDFNPAAAGYSNPVVEGYIFKRF